MHHVPPYGATDPDQNYDNGNILLGLKGSRVDAALLNLLLAELKHVVTSAGLSLDPDDQTQIAQAIEMLSATEDLLNQANVFNKAQRGIVTVLNYAASLNIDLSLSNNFTIANLTGNITLAAPSSIVPGQSGSITFIQDATGGRIITYDTIWKFQGGVKPALSTTAGAVDKLYYYVRSAAAIDCYIAKGMA